LTILWKEGIISEREIFEKYSFLPAQLNQHLIFNQGLNSMKIPQDSGIGFAEGEPVRARDMDVPSQCENFNHPDEKSIEPGIHTLSVSKIYPPKFGGGLFF
jgi:hypothetical protein